MKILGDLKNWVFHRVPLPILLFFNATNVATINMSSVQPLPVGVGYGVVVGIGFFFAAVMCGISYIQV